MPSSREKVIVGLDIGTSKVSTLIGQITRDNQINIAGYGVCSSQGLNKGVIVNIDDAVKSIGKSVEIAESLAGFKIGSAYVGVSGSHISSVNSRGVVAVSKSARDITQEDVARAISSARSVSIPAQREVLHVIPRTFSIDGQGGVRNPVGMNGYRLEVETHIVTGAVSSLNNLFKAVHRVGIEVDELVLKPLAASEVILGDAEKRLGVLLVDIGMGTTDIAIYIDGSIWHTAILPVGSGHITNDIAVVLKMPLEAAEKLKLEHGDASVVGSMKGYYGDYYGHDNWKLRKVESQEAKEGQADEKIEVDTFAFGTRQQISRSVLNQIIYARTRQIFEMVQSEIKKSGYDAMIPAGAVLTGGGALMPGITDAAAQTLRMPVRIGSPRSLNGISETLGSPTFSASTGLVLWGLHKSSSDELQMEIRRNSSGGVGKKFRGWLREFLP